MTSLPPDLDCGPAAWIHPTILNSLARPPRSLTSQPRDRESGQQLGAAGCLTHFAVKGNLDLLEQSAVQGGRPRPPGSGQSLGGPNMKPPKSKGIL